MLDTIKEGIKVSRMTEHTRSLQTSFIKSISYKDIIDES